MSATSASAVAIGLRGFPVDTAKTAWAAMSAATALCVFAAALGASQLVGRPPLWVALVVAAGAGGAALLTKIRIGASHRLPGFQLLLATGVISGSVLTVPLIVWLHRTGSSKAMHTCAVVAGCLLFIGITISGAFIARAFGALAKRETDEVDAWLPESPLVKAAEVTWFGVLGLPGTFIVDGLLTLGVVLEKLRDPAACTRAPTATNQWLLPTAALGAGTLCLVAHRVRRQQASQPFSRAASRGVAALLVAASVIWGVVPYAILRPSHIELFAGLVAGGALWLFVHGLLYHAAREDLEKVTLLSRVTAVVVGLGCASAMFWLFSAGLWSGNEPATPSAATRTSLAVFGGTAAVVLITLRAIQQRPSSSRLTLYPAVQNIVGDLVGQLLLGILLVICVGCIGQVSAGCRGVRAVLLLVSATVIVPIAWRLGQQIYRWVIRDYTAKGKYLLQTFADEGQRDLQLERLRGHLVLQAGWAVALGATVAGWLFIVGTSAVHLT